jgi:hypothetical protein
VVDEGDVAELRSALKQKLNARIIARRSAEGKAGPAVGARQAFDEVVAEIRVELQEKQNECLERSEAEAAKLFQAVRERLLPQVISEIAEDLTD